MVGNRLCHEWVRSLPRPRPPLPESCGRDDLLWYSVGEEDLPTTKRPERQQWTTMTFGGLGHNGVLLLVLFQVFSRRKRDSRTRVDVGRRIGTTTQPYHDRQRADNHSTKEPPESTLFVGSEDSTIDVGPADDNDLSS